jgi:hypothetical protein
VILYARCPQTHVDVPFRKLLKGDAIADRKPIQGKVVKGSPIVLILAGMRVKPPLEHVQAARAQERDHYRAALCEVGQGAAGPARHSCLRHVEAIEFLYEG